MAHWPKIEIRILFNAVEASTRSNGHLKSSRALSAQFLDMIDWIAVSPMSLQRICCFDVGSKRSLAVSADVEASHE
jgi:hypothetical protein